MTSDTNGEIRFYLNGFIPLLNFNLTSLIKHKEVQYAITGFDFSKDMDFLMVMTEEKDIGGSGAISLNQKYLNMEIMRGMNTSIVVKFSQNFHAKSALFTPKI